MGIKSTLELTREHAESQLHYLLQRILEIRTPIEHWSDRQLEDELDALEEELCDLEGRTCFRDYIIRS